MSERILRDRSTQTTREPSSLARSVYSSLKADILSCRLVPGVMLGAAQLAERFDVSRTPVHEALKALAQEGLVRVLPRVGYVVTPVTLHDIDEIFQLRLSLEVQGARRAAELVTDEDVARLRVLHAHALEAVTTGTIADPAYTEGLMRGNRDFHTTIADLSGNHRLATIVGTLLDEGQRIYCLYFRANRPAAKENIHERIIDALDARDPRAAGETMAAHVHEMWDGTRAGGSQLP